MSKVTSTDNIQELLTSFFHEWACSCIFVIFNKLLNRTWPDFTKWISYLAYELDSCSWNNDWKQTEGSHKNSFPTASGCFSLYISFSSNKYFYETLSYNALLSCLKAVNPSCFHVFKWNTLYWNCPVGNMLVLFRD